MFDYDKLLLLVDTARRKDVPTTEKRIHYYTFFSKQHGVPFNYHFQLLQDLYSSEIHQDINLLTEGNYLHSNHGLYLTEKGEKRIKEHSSPDKKDIQTKIDEIINEYGELDELTMFKDAHAKITKEIQR